MIRNMNSVGTDENGCYNISQTKRIELVARNPSGLTNGLRVSKLRDSLHVSRRCLEVCNRQQRASIVHTCAVSHAHGLSPLPTPPLHKVSQSARPRGQSWGGERQKVQEHTWLFRGPDSSRPPLAPSPAAVHHRASCSLRGCFSLWQQARGRLQLACTNRAWS